MESLDQHLCNMIPNAGKQLARSSIPSPIPNPSIKVRQQSLSERCRTPSITPISMKKFDRNMTQRMSLSSQKNRLKNLKSTNIAWTQKRSAPIGSEQCSTVEAKKNCKPIENAIDSHSPRTNESTSKQTETPKKTENLESSKQNVQKSIILNSPEMVAMYNAIIEKDPEKMNECIQKSLADHFSDFFIENSA